MRTLLAFMLSALSCFGAAVGFNNPTPSLQYGLVGWWPMNEGSGTNVFDKSGFANKGVFTNIDTPSSFYWTNSLFGNGVYFVTNTAIGFSTIAVANNYTMSIWACPVNGTVYSSLFASPTVGVFWRKSPASIDYYAPASQLAGNGIVPINSWTHICISGLKLYINGVFSFTFTSRTSIDFGYIGDDPTKDGFTGTLNNALIYNRALSASEVLQLYHQGRP